MDAKVKRIAGFALAIILTGCGSETTLPDEVQVTPDVEAGEAPPPLPEGVETVDFESTQEAESAIEGPISDVEETESGSTYWGLEEGEPIPLMWEDLMPEGSEEELARQYDEFYTMLEKRYAANMTTLADAAEASGDFGRIAEGSEFDYMPQLGTFDVVEDLDGQLIRMPGYIAPFEFSSNKRHKEFLFVPYMGACIHTPPPPPNQIIFVKADPAAKIEDIWAPYWIEGTLTTDKTENELGDTAYSLAMDTLEPYYFEP